MPGAMPGMPGALPEVSWLRCIAATGQEYFHNAATNQTIWERPAGPQDRILDHPALTAQVAQQQQAQLQAQQAAFQSLAVMSGALQSYGAAAYLGGVGTGAVGLGVPSSIG